ncbi:MAG TPA: ATP-binding protein [Steroidobacteraceae bacterium]|nr:ATP-binding protein [Steroidobacteraceae bacterium]
MPNRIIHASSDGSVTSDELLDRLRLALDFSEIGEWTWDAESDALNLSPLACKILGLEPNARITWSEMQAQLINEQDAPRAAAAVLECVEKRTPYRMEYRVRRPVDGAEAWLLASGKARHDQDGALQGMIGLIQDITPRKLEQLALAEEAESLEILNRVGALVASELDIDKVVQAVTDAGVQITGAEFGAFFYNVIAETGEQYMLYTLSGVPREAFASFPMPRNTKVFAATFDGVATVRSDDITKDPRYGHSEPHRGMPKGHLPVRSYLAVPVKSRSDDVVGGLFFGHSQPGTFTARDERLLVGISAQAAVAIDNGRLYQRAQREIAEKQRAEDALRAITTELEARVRTRTAELEASNAKLKREIEERERTEEVLRHAQKLEAIGQLTGGVAHDFNNLLTIVIGNMDTIARRIDGADPRLQRAIEHAMEGAHKAAALTQRLLAFARRQPLKPEPADPNRLVQQMSELLYRTLGERIEIETVLAAGIWAIEVDVGQLESAILNLAVNARDAMPDGGKLTIETTNAYVDEAYAREHAIAVGQYVVICVSDTGTGIPRDVMDKVFDPFFTTKSAGQGTGLGLSQVYGFVKQSGGNVRIYSEANEGTTVKLYLPRYAGKLDLTTARVGHLLPADRNETILVVEDEERVRQLSVSLLQELGYQVIDAPDGATALALLERTPRIDLLFTDVGLPRMNGRQLADEARRRVPGLKVLFTTGYAKNAIVHHGRLDPDVHLIGKPFTFTELSEKVRAVLDKIG